MSSISIAIPTYNNAQFLDYLLEANTPLFEKYKIRVFISDNDSTDNTNEIINKWKVKYSLITSRKVVRHVNFTKNTELALNLATTDFVWLMGDRYFIPEKTINYVLESIKLNPDTDLYVLNLEDMVKNIPPADYTNSKLLLTDLGPLMTCVSSLLIRKEVLKELDFKKFDSSGFAHFCSIFEYLIDKDFHVLWNPEYSVYAINPNGVIRKNWSHDERALSQAGTNWINSVFSLPPSYPLSSKLKCIQNFGVLSKLYTFRGISLMRLRGNLTYSNYRKYSNEIRMIVKFPKFIVILMSIFPRTILKILYNLISLFPKKITKKIGFVDNK
jgi:abequosyltransferase